MTTEEKFEAALNVIHSLTPEGPFQPSDELMLKFYAYEMQAKEGPCLSPKPSFWEVSARYKWNAWKSLGTLSEEIAMKKYVEELSNVIETMSYSEKVSNFISLLGPFYEAVWIDENDFQKVDLIKQNCPKKENESTTSPKEVDSNPTGLSILVETPEKPKSFTSKISLEESHGFTTSNSSKLTSCISQNQAISDRSWKLTKTDVLGMFKDKTIPKHFPVSSTKELLTLTVMNLQTSLEDISRRFERLENLAKIAANLEKQKACCDSSDFGLTFRSSAFLFLWPLAIQWCLRFS